jgi:hypothetical protein
LVRLSPSFSLSPPSCVFVFEQLLQHRLWLQNIKCFLIWGYLNLPVAIYLAYQSIPQTNFSISHAPMFELYRNHQSKTVSYMFWREIVVKILGHQFRTSKGGQQHLFLSKGLAVNLNIKPYYL